MGPEIKLLSATASPGRTSWTELHQCVSEGFAIEEANETWDDKRFMEAVIHHGLTKGHWGVAEGSFLTVNAKGFPHHTVMQLRTHRTFTFDVQSFRYSGDSYKVEPEDDLSEKAKSLFYQREVGKVYGKVKWNLELQTHANLTYIQQLKAYTVMREAGASKEIARFALGDDRIQNFTMGGSLRSWLHLLKLRCKKNAQSECQLFGEMMEAILREWAGDGLMDWYLDSEYYKSRPSP